jgi:hypothetical protein
MYPVPATTPRLVPENLSTMLSTPMLCHGVAVDDASGFIRTDTIPNPPDVVAHADIFESLKDEHSAYREFRRRAKISVVFPARHVAAPQ